MLKLWRELLISDVVVHKDSISINLKDSSVSFQMNKWFLRQLGINWRHVARGRRILIKGKEGNEDVHLWSADALDGIVLIPEKK